MTLQVVAANPDELPALQQALAAKMRTAAASALVSGALLRRGRRLTVRRPQAT